jgi:MOSC domain-containing protein YiiM
LKYEVAEAKVIEGFGIENDGHGGDWGRQITLLSWESVVRVNQEKNLDMKPGQYAENVLVEGLDLKPIVPGDKIKIGDEIVIEVSQVGKEDHPSVVTRTFGVTLLPYEGLFCRVISGGDMKIGDSVEVMN